MWNKNEKKNGMRCYRCGSVGTWVEIQNVLLGVCKTKPKNEGCLVSKQCGASSLNCRYLKSISNYSLQSCLSSCANNLKIEWIVEFFTTSTPERPNHLFKATSQSDLFLWRPPFNLQEKVENKIQELFDYDTIEEIDGPTYAMGEPRSNYPKSGWRHPSLRRYEASKRGHPMWLTPRTNCRSAGTQHEWLKGFQQDRFKVAEPIFRSRSVYLLNARSIFAIFLRTWTQCVDGFSLL